MQDLCLIPEVPFYLHGPGGLIEFVHKRLRENGHMVIVVAEGAGQELMAESMGSLDKLNDASGNKLLLDVGLWLCQNLKVRRSFIATREICFSFLDTTVESKVLDLTSVYFDENVRLCFCFHLVLTSITLKDHLIINFGIDIAGTFHEGIQGAA